MVSAKWAHIPDHGGYKGHRVSSQSRPSPGDLPCVRAQLATEDEEPVPDLHASGAGGCPEGPRSPSRIPGRGEEGEEWEEVGEGTTLAGSGRLVQVGYP